MSQMTNAQLQQLVSELQSKVEQLTTDLQVAKATKSSKKVSNTATYTDLTSNLTFVQVLILDTLVTEDVALTIKQLAVKANALAQCDIENKIGRIVEPDSSIEAQFRAVLVQMQIKNLVTDVRIDKLSYKVTDFGKRVLEAVVTDFQTIELDNLLLHRKRVTTFAIDYLTSKYRNVESTEDEDVDTDVDTDEVEAVA